MTKVAVIDCGFGNFKSIENMLKYLHISAVYTNKPDEIYACDKLILPGIGSFDSAVKSLQKNNILDVLHTKVIDEKTPILGICLGMQLFSDGSEEGALKGLGWIPGRVRKFNKDELQGYKIPQMGWNEVQFKPGSILAQGYENKPRFYFVHSYHYECSEEYIMGVCNYGYNFPAAVRKNNIMGIQFHPEKSHRFGLTLFKNFIQC